MSNNAQISALQCGVINNSSSSNAIGIVGGSSLNALSLGTVSSTWNNGSNISNGGSVSSTTKVIQGITSSCSPPVPVAPTYSNCVADPGGSSNSFTAGPASASGTVCYQALTVGANGSKVTLNPGTYVITTGALHFESGSGGHSNLGGNGVFFYLTGTASLLVDNGANINLVSGGSPLSSGGTAPTLGAYDGILVYQDTNDSASMSIQGGSNSYLSGGLFLPSAPITLGNGSSTTFNTSIVAQTLTMNGGAILNAVSTSNLGTLNISVSKIVQ